MAFVVCGCRIQDAFIDPNERVEEDSELASWTVHQNQWIYTQMKYHYLWSEELMDSLSYDYSLEPSRFFQSMKVPWDRFSYCTFNDEYIPSKGTGLNESVPEDSIYVHNGVKVGYFGYSRFATETDLTDIILLMKGVDELVIDLRGNPGGLIRTCLQLASYLAPVEALGKVFCRLQYNPTVSQDRQRMYGSPYTFYYLKSDEVTRSRNLMLRRVFILADGRTASSSELLVNCLRPYQQVILVGKPTVGKDVGMYSISSRQYKYVLEPITFRTYNADDVPVPETGLIPDLPVTEDPHVVDGKMTDPALDAVFQYLDNTDD